ncbi:MAG: cell envelope integrity protein TolA [Paraglaciecola sp.]|uniref:cell envelope integrity protein TolA n=1 Tax=Paraglaciecola sp. TaxID=1920173 RepID=UPI003296B649
MNLSTSFSLSFLLHLAVLVMVWLSADFSSSNETPEYSAPAPIIEAKAVDEQQLQQQVQKIKDQKKALQQKEEQRVKDLERRAAEAERRRKQQESEVSELKKQARQQEQNKKKAEQAAAAARERQKQEKAKAEKLEAERKRKELEKKKADELARQAKEKRDKEEAALKELERKRQQEKEQAQQQKLLEEQLQAEQAARQQRRNKQVLSEVQKYQALIKQTIERNLIVDDAMKGKSCRLNIRLASNGLVIQVTELGGNAILCRAAKAAVYKSDTLPVSKEADVNQQLRDINLTVEPKL